jgi:hypothetical protein
VKSSRRWAAADDLRALSLFVPFLREFKEMRFQTDRPYHVDSSRFAKQFWSEATPFKVGVRLTVNSFKN